MKKEYINPHITIYETDDMPMLCNSIGGGQPGNGEVVPQSKEYDVEEEEPVWGLQKYR